MRFKPGDRVVFIESTHNLHCGVCGPSQAWKELFVGQRGTVVATGPDPAWLKTKCGVGFEYKVLSENGQRALCFEGDMRPYYDGNEKSSWEILRSIWNPLTSKQPDKVNS